MSGSIDLSRQSRPMDPVANTGDEIVPETTSTIPEGFDVSRASDGLMAKLIRVHRNDNQVLKVLLKKDRLSFQKFIGYCVRGYLDADPYMLKFLKVSRELDLIPKYIKDKYVLSHRERSQILDEIERGSGE